MANAYCIWNDYEDRYTVVDEWFDNTSEGDVVAYESLEYDDDTDIHAPLPLDLSTLPSPAPVEWLIIYEPPATDTGSVVSTEREEKVHSWSVVEEAWAPTHEALAQLCAELKTAVPSTSTSTIEETMIRLCSPVGQPRTIYTLLKHVAQLTPTGQKYVRWWTQQPQPTMQDLCNVLKVPVPDDYKDGMKRRDLCALLRRMLANQVPEQFQPDSAWMNGSFHYGFIISTIEMFRKSRRPTNGRLLNAPTPGSTRLVCNNTTHQQPPGPPPKNTRMLGTPHARQPPRPSQGGQEKKPVSKPNNGGQRRDQKPKSK